MTNKNLKEKSCVKPMGNELIQASTKHIFHLFNIMQNHNIQCGVEFQTAQPDPLMGISYQPVQVDYIWDCGPKEETLIIGLGELEFGFNVADHRFGYEITSHQIQLCVSNDNYVAWFTSSVMSSEKILLAKAYDNEFDDKIIHMEINSEDFEDSFQFLITLIREGYVIKSVKVLGDGNQVITVGYVGQVSP